MAERENAAITPDEIKRDSQHGVRKVFAEQRDDIGRHVKGRALRDQEIEGGHRNDNHRHDCEKPCNALI